MNILEKLGLFCTGFWEGFKEEFTEMHQEENNDFDDGYKTEPLFPDYDDIYNVAHENNHPSHGMYNNK